MDYGRLADYFPAAIAKRLRAVDVDGTRSNQHEFSGVSALRPYLGDDDRKAIATTFAYVGDDAERVFARGFTTWYDARRRIRGRTEYRLYYGDNAALAKASPDDCMIIGVLPDMTLLILFAEKGSTAESQLLWLFGLDLGDGARFRAATRTGAPADQLAASVLESVGLSLRLPPDAGRALDDMLERFGGGFPSGREFSSYAEGTLAGVDWLHEPDRSLIQCYEREEMLFRIMERHVLESGFRDLIGRPTGTGVDVDGILRLSMSAFQRRKSRAGTAFENHLSSMFRARGIRFTAQCYTERRSRPDFIFPGAEEYADAAFPSSRLTMLGAKTTLKERWRQVLKEADRIEEKHLITLEPAVSETYTDDMRRDHLSLVVPGPIQETYRPSQRGWLLSVSDFCSLVERRQDVRAS